MAFQVQQQPKAAPPTMPQKGGRVVVTFSPDPIGGPTRIKATYSINVLHPYVFAAPTGADPKVFEAEVKDLATARDIPQPLQLVQATPFTPVQMVFIHISVVEIGPGASPFPENLDAAVTIENPGGQ